MKAKKIRIIQDGKEVVIKTKFKGKVKLSQSIKLNAMDLLVKSKQHKTSSTAKKVQYKLTEFLKNKGIVNE